MNEKQKLIQEKCIDFAVRADKLRKFLNKEKKEYNKADQVDRSASAIGALYSEAIHAEELYRVITSIIVSLKKKGDN